MNGVENAATLQKNSRVGVTASFPLTRHQSLKVSYAGGDYRILSAAWRRWPMTSPRPGGGLTSAGGKLTVSATVPPNARGTVRLPAAALAAVTESGRSVASAPGVTRAAQDGEDVVVEVGSGRYRFGYDGARLAEQLKPPPSPPAPGSNGL